MDWNTYWKAHESVLKKALRWRGSLPREDAEAVVLEALYECFQRGIPENRIQTRVNTALKREQRKFHPEEIPVSNLEVEDPVHASRESELLEDLLLGLEPDEREFLEKLYFEGVSRRELARQLGVSHQTVCYREGKLLGKLRRPARS